MNIPKIVHQSWHEDLQPLFDDFKMGMILETISKVDFYPKKDDVFRVFAMPMNKIRVVILGQDPYPNGEATGLAFGVKTDRNTPTSLRIIKKETMSTIYQDDPKIFSKNGYPSLIEWKTLEHWWKQGVFLLNTALTVEAKQAGSHIMIWQWFTRQIVDIISKKQPSVWLLWGTKAQGYVSYIHNNVILKDITVRNIDLKENFVLEAPHPAAEAYDPDTKYKFTGCDHFNLCNQILGLKNEKLIKW